MSHHIGLNLCYPIYPSRQTTYHSFQLGERFLNMFDFLISFQDVDAKSRSRISYWAFTGSENVRNDNGKGLYATALRVCGMSP
jgi:hypothetical protein